MTGTLKELKGRSIEIDVADVDGLFESFSNELALADEIVAIEADAHKFMAKAKKLDETLVGPARELRNEAIADRNFKEEVYKMLRDQTREKFYDLPEVKEAFERFQHTPDLLERFRVACREQLKALQQEKCVSALQELADATSMAQESTAVYIEERDKAKEWGDKGRELFEKANDLRKQLA